MPTLREQLRNLSTYEECEQMAQFIEAEISAARREVYLRCADQIIGSNDGSPTLYQTFRKWANEPPSGGKADGGGA